MLPDDYRWIDTPEASYLRRQYTCVAIVRPGRVTINRGTKNKPRPDPQGVCGSIAHGKRQVEAWLRANEHPRAGRPPRRP